MSGFPVTINGNTYTSSDFQNYGWQQSIPNITNDIAIVGGAAVVAKDTATSKAIETTIFASQAETFKNDAAASAANALASANAAGTGLQSMTTGTPTAYLADFSPDLTIVNGTSFRITFDKTCGNNPTLAIDGGAARNLVDGDVATFPNITSGQILELKTALVVYHAATNKYRVQGLDPTKLTAALNFAGQRALNVRAFHYKNTTPNLDNVEDELLFYTDATNTRLYGVWVVGNAGTCNALVKAGGFPITFRVAGADNTVLPVTSTRTFYPLSVSGVAGYVDYAEGTRFTRTITNVAGMDDMFMTHDCTGNL